MYDSSFKTNEHKALIEKIFFNYIVPSLNERAIAHDSSKLESPEKECVDKYTPLLKAVKEGTPEYEEIKKRMNAEGYEHHYAVNRHHPEHFKNGINDMNIIDLVELTVDWIADSKDSDESFSEELDSHAKKFSVPPMLKDIIANTYRDMKNSGWDL